MAKKRRRYPGGDIGETIAHALAGESDRGVPLVAAEFATDALEEYFRTRFSKTGINTWLQDELLSRSTTAPLNSFSMRINFARCFGMIGPETYKALEALRIIRNHCAHRTYVALNERRLSAHVCVLRAFADRCCGDDVQESLRKMWLTVGEDFSSISPERAAIFNGALMVICTVSAHEFYLKYDIEFGLV